MAEILRVFRLGIINLVGITMPGLFFICFISIGLILPVFTATFQINNTYSLTDEIYGWNFLYDVFKQNEFSIVLLVLLVAYVLGYLIRLWTADDLDSKSAKKVLKRMAKEYNLSEKEAADLDAWPYRGELHDRFPYFHLKEYLEKRGLKKLARLVIWDPVAEHSDDQTKKLSCQRSKSIVNMMKISVANEVLPIVWTVLGTF